MERETNVEKPRTLAVAGLSSQLGSRVQLSRVAAGQSMQGHGPGMPMEVSSSGTADLSALVMFVTDATKPPNRRS